jgi:hypothetical protein
VLWQSAPAKAVQLGEEAANRAAEGRHELDPGVVKKAVKRAVGGAGVCEEASWHSFRHC